MFRHLKMSSLKFANDIETRNSYFCVTPPPPKKKSSVSVFLMKNIKKHCHKKSNSMFL